MSTLAGLVAGIVAEPLEETRWLVLADWLEEFDDPRRAELLRLHRRLLATCCEPDQHPQRAEWQARVVSRIAEGVRPSVPQKTVALPGGVEMTFSFIPPGRFLMGSNHPDAQDNEKPVHQVTLTKGFYLGIYPVTQAQWKAVMGTNPSHHKGPDRPVECVLWDGCREFCQRLTAHVERLWTVRLPTEAEWEYACRAGMTTEYYTGEGEAALKAAGWYGGNAAWETNSVGMLCENAWGLFDMHGNIWEWCMDYLRRYTRSTVADPIGEGTDVGIVVRGGAWDWDAHSVRAASRLEVDPDDGGCNAGQNLGFRCSMSVP